MASTDSRQETEEFTLERYGGHSVGTWANALFVVALAVIQTSLLFSYYMVQHESPQWPPEGHGAPSLAWVTVATLTLLVSAAPLVLAYMAVRGDRVERLFLYLTAMLALGATFFFLQTVSYAQLSLRPIDSAYSALIVALAGFHLSVTLISLAMAGLVLYRALLRQFHAGRYLAIETLLFTWGFVVVSGLLTAGTVFLNPHL